MIMTSLYFLEEIPFHDVYIYATVLNEEGRRMSKSLGTGVDPLDTIEKYGADALRFALIQQTGKNQDMRFSEGRVEAIRYFSNKIWNISRFVLLGLEETGHAIPEAPPAEKLALEDKWILSRLQDTIAAVNTGLGDYDMDDAARALYEFLWNEYADWYIEMAKPRLRGDESAVVKWVLWHVLETSMRLMHPIMPFITEQIWQSIPHEGESIMVAEYPEADESLRDASAEAQVGVIMEIVRSIRNLRAESGITPEKKVEAVIVPKTPEAAAALAAGRASVEILGKVSALDIASESPATGEAKFISAHLPPADVYIPLAGLVDVDKEIARITNELASVEKDLARSSGKLANEQFLSKAAPAVVEKERRIARELTEKREKLRERLTILRGA